MKKIAKKLEKVFNEIYPIILILLVILLALQSMHVWKQIHNIDLIYNFERIQLSLKDLGHNVTLSDTGMDGVTRPLDDYYRSSINQLESTYIKIIILSTAIGLLIGVKYGRNI